MRLAYVCNEYPPEPHGGIGTFVQGIARGMRGLGHTVTVVGMGRRSGVHDDGGVTVVTLPMIHTRRVAWIANRWRLTRWLSERTANREIDLIETPEYEGLLAFGDVGCPVTVRLHLSGTMIQTHTSGRPAWSTRYCERRTLARHRNWIGVTQWMLQNTIAAFGIAPDRSRVIYNPAMLASAAALPFAQPETYVLYAGTVSERKGACTLARAAAQFLRDYPDLHLVYAGAVDANGDIRTRIAALAGADLVNRIHFVGRVNRSSIATLMRNATVFASPSRLEACSLVTIEAMLAGVPVIVPAAGPFPELVTHGQTGFIVPPEDPAAIAEAVSKLVNNPKLRAKLGESARHRAESRFSLARCLSETETFYEELMDAGPVTGAASRFAREQEPYD